VTRAQRLAGISLALGTAAVTAWFLTHYERGRERRVTGYLGAARDTSYHALRRLLEEYGAEVRVLGSVDELEPLPPERGTLFLPTRRDTLPAELTPRLRRWVEAGGHLIVVIWTLYEEGGDSDPLLDPLEVRQYFDEEIGERGEDERAPGLVKAAGAWMVVDFDPRYEISDAGIEAAGSVADAAGTHVLWYDLGAGRLSVFTDTVFWQNAALAAHDHGEFALRWFEPAPDREIWIADAETHLPLWRRFASRARAALLALGALLALALWRAAPRFGPLLPLPVRARRELGLHLDAAARHGWLWNRGELLAGVRGALGRELLRRRPALAAAGLDPLRALGDRLGLEPRSVERALDESPPGDAADFAERVRTLELLRKGL
jgi:hypothetical protein